MHPPTLVHSHAPWRTTVATPTKGVRLVVQVSGHYNLCYPTEPGQRTLWPSAVRLSAEYFASLERHAVPSTVGAIWIAW